MIGFHVGRQSEVGSVCRGGPRARRSREMRLGQVGAGEARGGRWSKRDLVSRCNDRVTSASW